MIFLKNYAIITFSLLYSSDEYEASEAEQYKKASVLFILN